MDDGWKVVEVEPPASPASSSDRPSGREAAPVNGNGDHAGGIGPTVELVLGNGHAAVEVNGNGHREEAPEPPACLPADRQQSLFSWAEFMAEEPVKPRGRGRKPEPATASLFDWALTVEQEREKELVGTRG